MAGFKDIKLISEEESQELQNAMHKRIAGLLDMMPQASVTAMEKTNSAYKRRAVLYLYGTFYVNYADESGLFTPDFDFVIQAKDALEASNEVAKLRTSVHRVLQQQHALVEKWNSNHPDKPKIKRTASACIKQVFHVEDSTTYIVRLSNERAPRKEAGLQFNDAIDELLTGEKDK